MAEMTEGGLYILKYIIVTGGVTSSLGKGVTAASIGRLLVSKGFKVSIKKFDPYLNVDPGTLSPCQHGEVFVTEDGGEADLDLGHYERFVDINLERDSDITTGKIYQKILEDERKGIYLGSTVQVIPHVTDEIKRRIYQNNSNADVTIAEIGGTVGDIESLPFLEAARQIKNEIGQDNVIYVHVALVPTVISEVKTKPVQHSVKELRSIGIQPDILICRTEKYGCLTDALKQKISMFCNVEVDAVIENHNVATIYELPRLFYETGLDDIIIKKLCLPERETELGEWSDIGYRIRALIPARKTVSIVGNYTTSPDAYLSVIEAVKHACLAVGHEVNITMIKADELEEWNPVSEVLNPYDGIIMIDSLDKKGFESKIKAVSWARDRNIPCFGICQGMQAMIAETVVSENFRIQWSEAVNDVLDQIEGSVRLGNYSCHLIPGSKTAEIYGTADITERYRNRYKIKSSCSNLLHHSDLLISGTSSDASVIETVERKDHRWFIGCQFHPEFKSRPDRPHPLFKSFIEAVLKEG